MKKVNTGTFQKVPSGYSAFVPANLPFEGIELDSEIISLLSKAERGIGELKSIELILPNANLLIQKYALKEALLSSQIEGTRTTIAEVIESKKDNMMDVREVKNCMEAMEYGHMDRIVVMDSGKVVEDGSFNELISKEGGKFKELWEHQVNGMVV